MGEITIGYITWDTSDICRLSGNVDNDWIGIDDGVAMDWMQEVDDDFVAYLKITGDIWLKNRFLHNPPRPGE